MRPRPKRSWHLIEVAKAVGISPITLRRWLLSGKVSEVQRDRNGWRIFTEKDVKKIKAFASRRTPPKA